MSQRGLKEERLHVNDRLSVDAWVKRHQNNGMVKYYKPQGELLEDNPTMQREDFCLILMDQSQFLMLNEYGSDIICIDGTHGLNNYNFNLYTLMVIDDLRQGYPVAFMFSNKKDFGVYQHFFTVVKNVMGRKVTPNVFMSDMEDTFYTAWLNVMGPTNYRLYCTWHVIRAWKKNLSSVKTKQKKQQVSLRFSQLLQETDIDKLDKLLDDFVDDMKSDDDTLEYGIYFENNYRSKASCWSYAYRMNAGINTNMSMERMHGVLKHIYLKGLKVKRLDAVISKLLLMMRDKLFDQIVTLERGKISSKIKNIRLRHKKSTSLDTASISEEGDDWLVKSSSSSKIYKIKLSPSQCFNLSCPLRCEPCGICIHLYDCTCTDSSIKSNLCKHTHLLAKYLKSTINNVASNTNLESAPSCSYVHREFDLTMQSCEQRQESREQRQEVEVDEDDQEEDNRKKIQECLNLYPNISNEYATV